MSLHSGPRLVGLEHLLEGDPILDVRAPVEFEQGSMPMSYNVPLLNDDERAEVGTRYKREGQDAAIRLGHSLISGDTKAQRVASWISYIETNPKAAVMCFRGGMRSHFVQQELARRGYNLPLVEGGYKKIRALLTERLNYACETMPMRILSGFTGAGKTEVLRKIHREGTPPIKFLDLEKAARHRGSSFGLWPQGQPSPVVFESELSLNAARYVANASSDPRPIWLEDESRSIGKLVLPARLFEAMSAAPVWVLERPREDRARRLTNEYLIENYGFVDGVVPATDIAARCELDVRRALLNIEKRLGGSETKHMLAMASEASARFAQTGSFAAHWPWVERLLEKYYDPSYEIHLDRIADRVIGRGPVEQFTALVQS